MGRVLARCVPKTPRGAFQAPRHGRLTGLTVTPLLAVEGSIEPLRAAEASGPNLGTGCPAGAGGTDDRTGSERGKVGDVISKTGEYALRAVLHILVEGKGSAMRANEIAQALGVPANYLSKTLHRLARAGILSSERGPRGGFRLARSPGALSLADVLRPLDPSQLECSCLLGLPRCSDEDPCPFHERWKRVRGPVCQFFEETTLAEVLRAPGAVPVT